MDTVGPHIVRLVECYLAAASKHRLASAKPNRSESKPAFHGDRGQRRDTSYPGIEGVRPPLRCTDVTAQWRKALSMVTPWQYAPSLAAARAFATRNGFGEHQRRLKEEPSRSSFARFFPLPHPHNKVHSSLTRVYSHRSWSSLFKSTSTTYATTHLASLRCVSQPRYLCWSSPCLLGLPLPLLAPQAPDLQTRTRSVSIYVVARLILIIN